MTKPIDPVLLLRDVLERGTDKATVWPRLRAQAVRAELVVHDNRGMPGVLLGDGTVLVLSWPQMRALRDAFDQWCELGVDVKAAP